MAGVIVVAELTTGRKQEYAPAESAAPRLLAALKLEEAGLWQGKLMVMANFVAGAALFRGIGFEGHAATQTGWGFFRNLLPRSAR